MPDQPGQQGGRGRGKELIHGVPNVALIAGGVAFAAILLLFMFRRGNTSSQPAAQAAGALSPGTPTGSNQPAILPFPYPAPGQPGSSNPSGGGKIGNQVYQVSNQFTGLFSNPPGQNDPTGTSIIGQLTQGSQVTGTGAPAQTGWWGGKPFVAVPVTYFGQSGYVNAADLRTTSLTSSSVGQQVYAG